MGTGVMAILIDFWLIGLPQPYLWRLRLPTRERAVVIVLTSLGLLAATACIIRHHYLIQNHDSEDPTWDGHSVWIWALTELHLDIICSSVPPLRMLVRQWFLGLEGKISGRNSSMPTTDYEVALKDADDLSRSARTGERHVRLAAGTV